MTFLMLMIGVLSICGAVLAIFSPELNVFLRAAIVGGLGACVIVSTVSISTVWLR